jgi:hypothetical protein
MHHTRSTLTCCLRKSACDHNTFQGTCCFAVTEPQLQNLSCIRNMSAYKGICGRNGLSNANVIELSLKTNYFHVRQHYHYQTHGLIELMPEGLRKRLDFSLSLYCVSRMNRRTQIAEIFDLSATSISDKPKSSKFKGATKTSG